MKLFWITISLLYFTQASEVKECFKYMVDKFKRAYSPAKDACVAFKGKVASEDLKDSESAKKAIVAVYLFRAKEKDLSPIWLGINSRELGSTPHKKHNPFTFSDGTEFEEKDSTLKWAKNEPDFRTEFGCTYLEYGVIKTSRCDGTYSVLCRVPDDDCIDSNEKKCPISS